MPGSSRFAIARRASQRNWRGKMLRAPIDLKNLTDEELRNMALFADEQALAKVRSEYKRRMLRRLERAKEAKK